MQDIEEFLGEFGLAVPQERAEAFRERFAAGWRAADGEEFPGQTPPETGARVRFTDRMAGGGGMTREEIMAIPDRRKRRAAIAQNLNLFEKEN